MEIAHQRKDAIVHGVWCHMKTVSKVTLVLQKLHCKELHTESGGRLDKGNYSSKLSHLPNKGHKAEVAEVKQWKAKGERDLNYLH